MRVAVEERDEAGPGTPVALFDLAAEMGLLHILLPTGRGTGGSSCLIRSRIDTF